MCRLCTAFLKRLNYTPYGVARHHWAGDLDSDGAVTSADQALAVAGKTIGDPDYNVDADLNRDGVVTSDDFPPAPILRAALRSGFISNPDPTSGPDNPIGYAGYVFNPETLLFTVRFRTYDPEMGRWMERDPLGYFDARNLHVYVRSAPTRWQDPLGLCATPDTRPRHHHKDSVRSLMEQEGMMNDHYGEWCAWARSMSAVVLTLYDEVTPDISIKFGFYESIDDKDIVCCRDGKEMTCTRTGYSIIFGLQAEATAEWAREVKVCIAGDPSSPCEADGRHVDINIGADVEGNLFGIGAGAEAKFGYHFGADGENELYGEACGDASLGLPFGLGVEVCGTLRNDGLIEFVGKIQAKYGGRVGLDFGSYNSYTVGCTSNERCCSDG